MNSALGIMVLTHNSIFTSRQYEFYRSNLDLGLAWRGKSHTMESRNKIRKTMTPQNSTNPRVWVSKDGLTKYILKTDLDFYISRGFELGRKKYKPRHNAQGSTFNIGVKQLEKVKKIKKIKDLWLAR